jgi:SAM-dependent methyltransferase
LDFGCGIGRSVAYFKKHLKRVSFYGIDVSEGEIKVAKANNKKFKNVEFSSFDGFSIPFKTKFDVIFVANVFHHIRRQDQGKVMKNIVQHLANNGYLFIFEHNPLNPLTQWIYYKNDFQFDKNSNLLTPFRTGKMLRNSGLFNNKLNFAIFFPHFLSFLIPFEKYLRWLPLGAHYFYIAKK